MSLPVVLRPEARAEFDEAVDWYEQQRPGLGAEFVAQVQAVLDRISATPELYGQVFRGVRRAVVRRFPYAILFQIEPRQAVILAIFHGRRDPKLWQARA